ncbi:MAG: hypothetical protein JWN34_1192, partial [Bryobacterales bacterium]|nr:hypothetical protein [Bryobacterales bacterium]
MLLAFAPAVLSGTSFYDVTHENTSE